MKCRNLTFSIRIVADICRSSSYRNLHIGAAASTRRQTNTGINKKMKSMNNQKEKEHSTNFKRLKIISESTI